jgi:hypothetical protein
MPRKRGQPPTPEGDVPVLVRVEMPPVSDEDPPERRLPVLALFDALNSEDVWWPCEYEAGWRTVEHLCSQIPDVEVAILLPTGGRIRREPIAGGYARRGEEPA